MNFEAQLRPIRKFKSPPLEGLDLPAPPLHLSSFDLEIGAGAGLHALTYALTHPNRYLVALERTAEKFGKMNNRNLKYGGLPNLLALRADAQWWVSKNLNTECLERIFLLYPNPYLKKNQYHLRFHRSPFMGRLLKHLKPGGSILLATNIQSYLEEAEIYFRDYWKLDVRCRKLPNDLKPRTHFEKKYLESSQSCFELQAFKTSQVETN